MVRLETAPTVRKIGQIGLIGYKDAIGQENKKLKLGLKTSLHTKKRGG